jgi:chromosome segregation ATPase
MLISLKNTLVFPPPVRPGAKRLQVETLEQRLKNLAQGARGQVASLNKTNSELKTAVANLTMERDELKAKADPTVSQGSPDLGAFQDRIAALEQEKSSLEVSLNEVRAKATELSNQTATLVGG